jgi:hypothetical protein
MKKLIRTAVLTMLFPVALFAQGYKDLDSALSSVSRGFERGETQAVVGGVAEGDQVMLSFPGLVQQTGFFGRDQAAYLLDQLFQKAKPTGFEQISARKISAEGQYHITAKWTITRDGKQESRELYITLRNKNDRWALASVRSAGQ